MRLRDGRLRLTGCCLLVSVVTSACGSTVAMTSTTSTDGLSAQDSLGGNQVTTAVTQGSAPATPALPGTRQGTALGGGRDSGGLPSPDPVPSLAAAGPAPTGPLRFGLLDVSSSTAAVGAIGGKAQTSVTEQSLSRAFIRYFNAHGGIAGRTLQAVEYTQDPNSGNYATDMEAACAAFTQDNRVSVVLRAQLGGVISDNYENCLTKAGVTSLAMSFASGDDTLLRQHPGLYNVAAPSVDRRMRAVLMGLTATGYLSGKSRIGMLVEDCPENKRAYDRTVAPVARSLGLTIETRSVSCLRGFGDVGAFAAQVQSAVLPFRSAGVDRVMFLSTWEVLMLLFFETGASNQGWRPSYGLSSNSPVGSTAGQFSNEQLSRMRGIGWAPNSDTGTPLATATAKQCDGMAKAEGLSPQTQGDLALTRSVCDLFLVYKAAVEAAGGRDDAASMSAGLAVASRDYRSAAVLGSAVRLGQGRQDAPTQVAEFGFVAGCSCFRYVGPPRRLA